MWTRVGFSGWGEGLHPLNLGGCRGVRGPAKGGSVEGSAKLEALNYFLPTEGLVQGRGISHKELGSGGVCDKKRVAHMSTAVLRGRRLRMMLHGICRPLGAVQRFMLHQAFNKINHRLPNQPRPRS